MEKPLIFQVRYIFASVIWKYISPTLSHCQIVFAAYNTLVILNIMQNLFLMNNKNVSKLYQYIIFKLFNKKSNKCSIKYIRSSPFFLITRLCCFIWSFGTPKISIITNVSALLDDEWQLGGNWIPLMSCTKIREFKNWAECQTAPLLNFKIK